VGNFKINKIKRKRSNRTVKILKKLPVKEKVVLIRIEIKENQDQNIILQGEKNSKETNLMGISRSLINAKSDITEIVILSIFLFRFSNLENFFHISVAGS
jgi:hypothetical protein